MPIYRLKSDKILLAEQYVALCESIDDLDRQIAAIDVEPRGPDEYLAGMADAIAVARERAAVLVGKAAAAFINRDRVGPAGTPVKKPYLANHEEAQQLAVYLGVLLCKVDPDFGDAALATLNCGRPGPVKAREREDLTKQKAALVAEREAILASWSALFEPPEIPPLSEVHRLLHEIVSGIHSAVSRWEHDQQERWRT